jgi:hypothetical protein
MLNKTTTLANNSVLDILRATYQTIFISAIDAGKEIGIAPGTTRNMLTEGRFPLPTQKIGVKRVVSIFVLADFVMQRSQIASSTILPVQNKRGARAKAVRMQEQGRA